jgi:hypothetical protein
VVRGERYAVVPEEVVKYALGWYGKPVAPLDPDVLDRILATPAAHRFARREPLAPMIPEIRRRFGTHLSDEEVLLRIIFPERRLSQERPHVLLPGRRGRRVGPVRLRPGSRKSVVEREVALGSAPPAD